MAAEFDWLRKKASGVPKIGIHAITSYKYTRYVNQQTILPDMRLNPIFPGMSFWQPMSSDIRKMNLSSIVKLCRSR
jgi:hypothetical protein